MHSLFFATPSNTAEKFTLDQWADFGKHTQIALWIGEAREGTDNCRTTYRSATVVSAVLGEMFKYIDTCRCERMSPDRNCVLLIRSVLLLFTLTCLSPFSSLS
jgi:hypothetical protein